MDSKPLVTIGVVSYNRLRYLRALMESVRECIRYPNIQWIVMDGNSKEPGLKEYVEGLDFVQHKIFATCTHAEAMNTIVQMAQGEFLMILPEDVQFIVRGNWLEDLVEVAGRYRQIGNIVFDYPRKTTIQRMYGNAHLHLRLGSRRKYIRLPFKRHVNIYRAPSGAEFLGMGNMREGICGSGIMSFSRTQLWRDLGPWRMTNSTVGNDSSLGAEDDMVMRYFRCGKRLENVMMRYCVAANIVTDMTGTKARVRGGNRRYGNYLAPPQGMFYYQILDPAELTRFSDRLPAPGFEEVVQPLGFQLPFDEYGSLLKATSVDLSGPFEQI